MATHCGLDFETSISLRVNHYTNAPYRGRMGFEPMSLCVLAITLPRVIGVMTSDYSNG